MSVYCNWVKRRVRSAASVSVQQQVNLSEQIRYPKGTLHVTGTIGERETLNTGFLGGNPVPYVHCDRQNDGPVGWQYWPPMAIHGFVCFMYVATPKKRLTQTF